LEGLLMRVIGYLRVSTTEQAKDGYGLPAQWQRIVDWCRSNGCELVEMSEDAGVRGALPLG
jgi:site-specific DNA recombinase